MASPNPLSFTATPQTSWTRTHAVSLPTTAPAQLLVMSWLLDGLGGEITPPSGWTEALAHDLNANQKWRVWVRETDGTEDTTATVVTTGTNRSMAVVALVNGQRSGVAEGTTWDVEFTESGYGTKPDPPSTTTTWSGADNLALALCAAPGSGASVDAYPAGYSNGTEATAGAGGTVGIASLQVTADTIDPGQFTLTNSSNIRAATLVIRNASAIVAGAQTATGSGTGHTPTVDPPTVTASAETATGGGQALWARVEQAPPDADLQVLVDTDGDGDFDESVEDWTTFVLEGQARRGRSFGSQVQGRAAPSTLDVLLNNADGRFNQFEASSPLNTSPHQLRAGMLCRVQTTDASVVDPVELARDRFGGAGPLTTADTGETWTAQVGTVSEFQGALTADGPPVPSGSAAGVEDPSAWTWATAQAAVITIALRHATGETVSLRSSSTLAIGSSDTSHDLTLPATIEADDLIVVACSTQDSSAAGPPTTPSGFTLISTQGGVSSFDPEISIYYKVADGTEDSTTVTFAGYGSPTELHAVAVVYDGVDTSTPLDAAASTIVDVAANPDPASITVTAAGARVLLFAVGNQTGSTPTPTISTGYSTDVTQVPGTPGFVVAAKSVAAASDAGAPHVSTLPIGASAYYAQVVVPDLDTVNEAGIVIHWTDSDNYARVVYGNRALSLVKVVAGTASTVTSVDAEARPGAAVGVDVGATNVTVCLDGVDAFTAAHGVTATSTGGVWLRWFSQRSPSITEFQVWDRSRKSVATTGVVGTYRVQSLVPSIDARGNRTARLSAVGPLARLDRPVRPPTSIGPDDQLSAGIYPGHLVGGTLARLGLLHPPGPIDRGDVALGSVALGEIRASEAIRRAEATELGRAFETPDGAIGFEDRSARDGSSVTATFTDDPTVVGEGIERITVRNWAGDIINEVSSRVSPSVPRPIVGESWSTDSNSTAAGVRNDVTLSIPAAGTGATDPAVGDLALAVIASTVQNDGTTWEAPAGWAPLRAGLTDELGVRVFARRLADGDFGASVTFYDDDDLAGGAWVCFLVAVKSWFGVVASGVAMTEVDGVGGASAQALAGTTDPPTALTPWAAGPTAFLVFRVGLGAATSGSALGEATDDVAPNGFDTLTQVSLEGTANGFDVAAQVAVRLRSTSLVDPEPFGGEFTGFDLVESFTIAVRGYAGSPPPETGDGRVVTSSNAASQLERGSVSAHPSPGALFSTEADALAYNDAVLTRYDADRPLLAIGYTPTASNRLRSMRLAADLSDRVRVDANSTRGVGIDAEYFVESITDRFGQRGGNRFWSVDYELSPAVDPGAGAD